GSGNEPLGQRTRGAGFQSCRGNPARLESCPTTSLLLQQALYFLGGVGPGVVAAAEQLPAIDIACGSAKGQFRQHRSCVVAPDWMCAAASLHLGDCLQYPGLLRIGVIDQQAAW